MSSYKYTPLQNSGNNVDFSSYYTFSGDKKTSKNQLLSFNAPQYEVESSNQSCIDCICTSIVIFLVHLLFLFTLPFSALCTLKLVRQYERFIIYRLGRLRPVKGPGIVLVLPCIDRYQKVDLRTKAFNVPPSKVCTTDGCVISIGAIVQFRIIDPMLMSLSVQDIDHALRDCAMSDMTNLLCKKSYNDIKTKRINLAYDLQTDINQSCKEWGVEVGRIELSDISLLMAPQNKPSAFMPMHGAEPLPQMSQGGGDGLGGFAQLAQQLFVHAVNASQNEESNVSSAPDVSSLVDKVGQKISSELIDEVATSYEFHINGVGTYHLDLKTHPGLIGRGGLPNGLPDVKIFLTQDTFQGLFSGSISPTVAYASNQLRIEGSITDAKKLDKVFQLL